MFVLVIKPVGDLWGLTIPSNPVGDLWGLNISSMGGGVWCPGSLSSGHTFCRLRLGYVACMLPSAASLSINLPLIISILAGV